MLFRSPAQETIGGFKLCGENYKDALKLLKETYGNTQIIINTHIQNLINFEAVHDIDDVDSLRALYNHLEVQIRSYLILLLFQTVYHLFIYPGSNPFPIALHHVHH